MTRDPITHAPDDTIGVAAQTLARRHVRRVPIVEAGQLVGIVAKSDLLSACPADFNPFSAEALAAGADSLSTPLREIMTSHPLTVRPDAPVEVAAQTMIDNKIGGLPVVSDHLVGILTESDLFRALTAALGAGDAGLRITFDVSANEDAVIFAIELAQRHGLRLASVSTHVQERQRHAVVRLVGPDAPALVDDLWATGHRVLSVLRLA
jgi:acetoin utilization protein AcuB